MRATPRQRLTLREEAETEEKQEMHKMLREADVRSMILPNPCHPQETIEQDTLKMLRQLRMQRRYTEIET